MQVEFTNQAEILRFTSITIFKYSPIHFNRGSIYGSRLYFLQEHGFYGLILLFLS